MAKIVKQYTKFIFPFTYEKEHVAPGKAILMSKKGAQISIFEPFSQSTEALRDGLDALLSQEGGASKIADCYRLNINCRRDFNLPPRKNEQLSFISRQSDEVMKVAITDLKLYFFESSVGFAELECEYESDSLDEYIHLNYFIGEAKSDKNRFIYHEKVWNEEKKDNEVNDRFFTVESLLDSVFAKLSLQKDAVKLNYRKSKPMIYSYVLLDQRPENMGEVIHNIANNYKLSYKFDDSCAKVKTLTPFENSTWAASLNGVVNVSFLTGDEITDSFFTSDFLVKTRNTYFFLYLNIIHQRGAVIRLMGEMGQLDRLENDYYVMDDQLRIARRYEMEAINLKFRAFFRCPSTYDHINNYYDMLYSAYQIGDYYDHFSADMSNLQGICSKYVERIKERDKRFKQIRSARAEIFISVFGAVVGTVTLFNNSWSLVEKVMGHAISFLNPGILILCLTLISSLITIAVNVSKKIGEIKSLKKLIATEQKENLVEDDKYRKIKGRLISRIDKKNQKKKQ